MVAFRSLLTTFVVPLLFLQSVLGAGLFESESSHQLKRQAVVSENICATVDLTLLGITFARDVCICVAGGQVTPESVLTIQTQITANSGILAGAINLLGGLVPATQTVVNSVLPILINQPTSCVYPENSIPNQCGGCGYECASGFVACGNQCIAPTAGCVSGIPTRRDLRSRDTEARCPTGFEACLIPSAAKSTVFTGRNFECIKTVSDLESCGGCAYPLPGRPLGQDCSAIPNVGSATCQAGKCVIETCERGFTSNGTACIGGETNGRKLSGYWAALQESTKIVLQE